MFRFHRLPAQLLIAVICILAITGCSSPNVSEDKYNELLQQNQRLISELEPLQESINTKITGSFVATVRQLSPDYCGDCFTPRVAVLTCFQTGPFMVHVGKEMASKLKIGESYYFEIADQSIGEITKAEFEKGCPSVEAAYALYYFKIKSFRAPKESEGGLDSVHIIYEPIDK